MTQPPNRREFLTRSTQVTAGLAAAVWAGPCLFAGEKQRPPYKISCTEYSLHRMIGKGELDNLDYAPFVKTTFDIDAVEYWNRPFFNKARDKSYLREMKKRADEAGVTATCILIDGEGNLGDPDLKSRKRAVVNHHKWVEAAKLLGCHSIRVNARSRGSFVDQLKYAADGLRRLSEFGKQHDINVVVENHGGLSSNGVWLAAVMEAVDMDHCGTLPDFGNFGGFDRYRGTDLLMPYAKLVSAKSHEFDEQGNEKHTDYRRMMKIVAVDHGYHDYVGIEFEGGGISEVEGVKKTKTLLQRVREELSKST